MAIKESLKCDTCQGMNQRDRADVESKNQDNETNIVMNIKL